MTTDAFYGGLQIQIGDGGDPETFSDIEEVTDISGLGEQFELLEATHFGSNGSKEYIAGLADGKEFSLTCNKVLTATQHAYIKANMGSTQNFKVIFNDGATTLTYDFAVVVMGWEDSPNNSDTNSVSFTFKISGGITES